MGESCEQENQKENGFALREAQSSNITQVWNKILDDYFQLRSIQ